MTPDAFGRFRVLHQIGAGTLGPVFRAHDPAADRQVAVKLFTVDLSPERVQQFVAELQNLVGKDLAHPALAAPLAAGIHGASAYLVQEFVAADSLDLVIREYGAAPANDALRVAAQLAGALDFANAVQVRHGALHPRDVLLSSDETRVTGFGVAHALEKIGIGAPVRRPYTPPERIAAGEWDRRSDVFSLAALVHELLWARRISGAGSRAAESLTPIPGADLNVLKAVFTRALAEDASERFETALEFADALRAAFPEAASASQPISLSEFSDHDDPGAVHILPQATPATQTAERRPPADDKRATPDERRPATEPALPLLDRNADVDLPLAEIARAENDRYRDVEVAPAIVPPAKVRAGGADAGVSSGYLDYVRDDQRLPAAAPQPAIAAPPIVARPVLPEPTLTHEPPRSAKVPVLLALAVGLMLGFGAGYGFGLRQRVAPAAAPATADATPPPGREFTESAVPEAPKPAPAPVDPTAPASNADARTAPPAATPPAVPPSAATRPAAASPAATPRSATPPPVAPRAATPPAAPAAPAADGRLLVRTTPAGARVFVDEREYGVTPFAVRNLARGGHRVRVIRDGYNTEDRRVVLSAAQPSQSLTIALERQGAAAGRGSQTATAGETGSTGRFAGDLFVESRPPGATVFLDGKAVGTTPLSLRAVPAGSHAIRLEHEGYRRWSSAVRVVASQANRITASLER